MITRDTALEGSEKSSEEGPAAEKLPDMQNMGAGQSKKRDCLHFRNLEEAGEL